MSYSYYLIHGITLEAAALMWSPLWPQNTPSVAAFAMALFTASR
jgi:hypothetical protein